MDEEVGTSDSEYERLRAKNIARNRQFLADLGVVELADECTVRAIEVEEEMRKKKRLYREGVCAGT